MREFRGPPPNGHEPALPVRAAFYYAWFPELWTLGGLTPYTHYQPSLGFYDSGSADVLRDHVTAMRYAGLDAGIWSWWGIGDPTDERFQAALEVARATPFRWAVYYEREGYGNPSVDDIRQDLEYIRDRYGSQPAYLRLGGRPVVFVYSSGDDCEVTDRWKQADPGGLFIVMKVFAGYTTCPVQPDGWHQYGADFATGINRQPGYATTIMPGFWKAGTAASPFPRDLDRWRANVRELAGVGRSVPARRQLRRVGRRHGGRECRRMGDSVGVRRVPRRPPRRPRIALGVYAASARRSSTVDPSSVSRRSKSPAQSDERSGAAPKLAAVPSPSKARTRTASSR